LRSDRVSFLVAALLVAAPAAVRAEASAARLDVDASPSCSTRDELIARVAARSTRIRFVSDGAGIPLMTARIDAGAKGIVIAELTVVEPDGRRFARRLEAPSCAAATDALALVVAITLDPSAATAETPPASDAKAVASAVTASPPPTAPAPEAAVARDGHLEGTPAGEAPPVASQGRLTVLAAGEVVTGPAPAAMPGVALAVQAALDRASIWSPAVILTLSHVFTADLSEPDGRAMFTLDLLGLDACPLRVVVFRLEARACAAGSVGRLSAQGSHTYDPRAVSRPFATAGGTLRLTVPVVWRVELRGRFGGPAFRAGLAHLRPAGGVPPVRDRRGHRAPHGASRVARRGARPLRRGGGPVARCVRIHSRRVSPGRFGYPGGGRGGRRAVSVIG